MWTVNSEKIDGHTEQDKIWAVERNNTKAIQREDPGWYGMETSEKQ